MKFLEPLFEKKETYKGEEVDLQERYFISKELAYDGIPTAYYRIYSHLYKKIVGTIDLRLIATGDAYYYGHIGYHINEPYRGHNYAFYACKCLFPIAKEKYGLEELIITCSPDNIASYKTLIKLKGELIETVKVPSYHELYHRGEKIKCIFRFKI